MGDRHVANEEDLALSSKTAPEENDILTRHSDTFGGESGDDDAFTELQQLLLGKEHSTITRLEGAVTGFISAVVRDKALDDLVREITGKAIRERLDVLRQEMPKEAARLIDEALSRELAIRRGDLQGRLGPIVDDAIRERIQLAERHIASILQPILEEVVSQFIAEGRQRLIDELSPEVLLIVKKRVKENRPRIEPLVSEIVEEMVGGALHDSVGRHLQSLVSNVRRGTEIRNRRALLIVAAAAALLMMFAGMWFRNQKAHLRSLENKVQILLDARIEALEHRPADSADASAKNTDPDPPAKFSRR